MAVEPKPEKKPVVRLTVKCLKCGQEMNIDFQDKDLLILFAQRLAVHTEYVELQKVNAG